MKANFTFPTRYRFGWGRRAELAAEVTRAGITRPLIVTDRGVASQPWFGDLAIGPVFDAISSNPTEDDVLAGVRAYDGCDGLVAIGGGAPMDVAKVIGIVVGHGPAPLARYAVGAKLRPEKMPPIVCVPTTSGTGSEVSNGAVIVDPAARVKRTFLHPALMPKAVVADPELTVALPRAITAATGMDALTHAIEALCAPGYQPMCDALAIEAIRLIHGNLVIACVEPTHVAARTHLMMASSLAAIAFTKGLGLCHAMAHPLGAVTGVHHGLANAVLLPHVLDHNRSAIEAACHRILAVVDPIEGVDYAGWVIATVKVLAERCGLPATLPRGDADPAALAQLALAEQLYLDTNPRPVTAAEAEAIYARVLVA